MTVEQLLARQGGDTGRRRASRRAHAEGQPRPTASPRPPEVRNGLPPVPGADPWPGAGQDTPVAAPSRRVGLPPVPGGVRTPPGGTRRDGRSAPASPVPPSPLPPHPSLPLPDIRPSESRPVRRTGPVPPLPGRGPAPSGAPPVGGSSTRRPAREVSPGRRRVVRAVVALSLVLGVIALYHLGLYFYVDRSISRVDALAVGAPEVIAPELQAGTETYLVVGTGVPGQTGAASVTTLLATVSADSERAVLLSLPPTALVDTPACRTQEGELREATTEPFAASLLRGGPSCMVRAVQQLSGLRIDHYLRLDLARLPGMVQALGEVPVCVPGSPAARAAAVPLPVGTSTVTAGGVAGWLAPGDDGSDVTGSAVAERTQLLLTSTLRAALDPGTLADPVTSTRFLARAADALTVDEQTTLGDLRVLASSLGDLSGGAVQRAEVPVEQEGYVPTGSETAVVLLDSAATRELFESVIGETRVPADVLAAQAEASVAEAAALAAAEQAAAAEASPEPDADGPPPLTMAPQEVTLDVLNGTGTSGLAASVAEELQGLGFGVGDVGNEPGTVNGTIVRHAPGAEEAARTVAAAVPGATLRPSDAIDSVQLVLGPGFDGVVAVEVPPVPAEPTGTGGEQPARERAPAPAPTATCS